MLEPSTKLHIKTSRRTPQISHGGADSRPQGRAPATRSRLGAARTAVMRRFSAPIQRPRGTVLPFSAPRFRVSGGCGADRTTQEAEPCRTSGARDGVGVRAAWQPGRLCVIECPTSGLGGRYVHHKSVVCASSRMSRRTETSEDRRGQGGRARRICPTPRAEFGLTNDPSRRDVPLTSDS